MNRNGKIIVLLICIAIIVFSVTHFFIIPEKNAAREQYTIDQSDSLTHNFETVLEYKSQYMGDSANLINLNYTLPLCSIPRTNELKSNDLKYIINYKVTTSEIGMNKLKRDLIYNATANFVLIDNLEVIIFNFTGNSYEITREDIQDIYGDSFHNLTDLNNWKKIVQEKLNDTDYVDNIWENYFVKQ